MKKEENIKICPIYSEDPLLSQVEELFKQLYDSEADFGISIKLVDNGEKLWRNSIEKMLGKFVQIIVAMDNNTVVGFSYGSIRLMPAYFGGIKVGYWEGMIIRPQYRKMGLGDLMTKQLMDWWREKGVTVFEGERLIVNENAKNNFERLGFKQELVKHRRMA